MINDFFKNYNLDPDTILVAGAPGVDDEHKKIVFDLLKENAVQTTNWLGTVL